MVTEFEKLQRQLLQWSVWKLFFKSTTKSGVDVTDNKVTKFWKAKEAPSPKKAFVTKINNKKLKNYSLIYC